MPARTDLTHDEHLLAALAVVRTGTAFFRRQLDRLSDVELDEPSWLPGWSRRHVVSHVGYNARAVARLVSWAATGVETPMYGSPQARAEEIELGSSLPPEALRHLAEHAAIDLDVRWRDLPPDRWRHEVRTAQGRVVPVSETVWMRTREVWLHAVDLRAGATIDQLPNQVLERMIGDVVSAWGAREDTEVPFVEADDRQWGASGARTHVRGSLSQVAAWVLGRSSPEQWGDLTWVVGTPHAAPRWI